MLLSRRLPATVPTRCRPNSITAWANSTSAARNSGNSLDAIMVLGGGYRSDGSLPPWVHRRLQLAIDLYHQHNQGVPITCLGAGTPHKPPVLDKNGFVLHEATLCANFLQEQGVPAAAILKEMSSYDTVGNAYFSLAIHAIPAGWRHMAVVTSDFHMPRTQQLFTDIYAMAARDLYADESRFHLSFHPASDQGIFEPAALQAREAKEASSISNWLQAKKSISGFQGLHDWLHQTHLCYAVARQREFGVPSIVDPKLLASY